MGDHIMLDLDEWAPRAQQDAQIPFQHLGGHQEDRADHSCRDEARVDSPRRGEVKLWQGGEKPSGRCGLWSMRLTSCRPSLPSQSARWTWTTLMLTSSRT